MASTLISSSRLNHTPTMWYDVFLSFRGEDTRHTFTDHLYHALLRAGLRTFRDDDEIYKGQELKPEIETAIVISKAYIVVLSENYANSRWCLDELCLILEQRRKCGHFILPVFYHVDPSDVRNQTAKFAIEGSKWTVDDVRRWKEALTMVANLTGEVLSRSETDFIRQMVDMVQRKLDLKQLSTPAHLTGMESRVEVISSWLKNEEASVIAICGMGGSGKTTLAEYIYNLNKHDFESSCFVEEIGKHFAYGVLGLQKQLLTNVLGGKDIKISNVSEGTYKIVEVLQTKKVLIVLDDIDDQDELNTLLGTNTFPTQSKIIITTRLLDVDAWFGSISWRCWVHKLKFLNELESLELLSWHAFGSKAPMEGFEELARQLAQYCGGNPLALKVLGSSLLVNDEDPNKINNMIEIWRERMNSLNSFKGDIDCKIQDVLRKSFDSLRSDSHKELFLDIACFFIGESKYMVTILKEDLYAKSGIMTLINKCLLTVSRDTSELMMHQLLQDMGRKIACDESKYPKNRSRVWNDDESYCLLSKGEVSETIESLALDMHKVDKSMRSKALALKTSSLAKMDKLKFLRLKFVNLTGSYKNFPKLRGLCWYRCPLKKMPSGLLMSSLVAIDMSYGSLKFFEAPTVLSSLKILNFEGCFSLVSICSFHQLPKLETLNLNNCVRLTHLCKSIEDLENLIHLDLALCTELWKSSRSKKYANQQERRKVLYIGGKTPRQPCVSPLKSFMVLARNYCGLGYTNDIHVVFHVQSLFKLCFWGNPYDYLPNNIDLNMLRILHLYCCQNLKSLPCIPCTLVELHIDWCKSLERVTFQSGRFRLQSFEYRGCYKLYEVQGLFKLVSIDKLDEVNLGHMKWIKAYQNHKVYLVGDSIAKHGFWPIQMLFEYGIMSTYLQGIKDQSMTPNEYTSSSAVLSFRVPLHKKKHMIRGLDISCSYRSLGVRKSMTFLLVKIRNRTKGLTWVYNPLVYCKSRVDEDVVWLSYWPIGSTLEENDEVCVDIIVEEGELIISKCGASLVYMDDGEVQEEENYKNNMSIDEEVIGGDLSEFEVTTGAYYLCRRDLFASETSCWLKRWFGDNIHYTESLGWKKTHHARIKSHKPGLFEHTSEEILLKVSFYSESESRTILRAVVWLSGVESVHIDREKGTLLIIGSGVDHLAVEECVRKFGNMVEIVSVESTRGTSFKWRL